MLSDILPTGFHAAVNAGVDAGSIVYVAGAGPVGLAAAASAHLLGAAVVMIGDMKAARLEHARSVGFLPIDLTKSDKLEDLIEQALGQRQVDAAIDAVGYEAHGHGKQSAIEAPATVLNSLMRITKVAGAIAIPGLYVAKDPGASDDLLKYGTLQVRFGLGWAKSHRFYTGLTPVLRYNRQLMQAILHERMPIAKSLTQLSFDWMMAPLLIKPSMMESLRSLSWTHMGCRGVNEFSKVPSPTAVIIYDSMHSLRCRTGEW
jgi:glutathione-independent formaldehyde dehydrogenase